jgi:iron complex transport system ATP-binding protein
MVTMRLEAQQVSYAYIPGQPVLRDVSLQLEAGETLYILGRNGGGKTTLLSCLAGLIHPTAGRILLDGKDIHSYAPGVRARLIGLIPQMHTPAFAYTVREMVLMGRAPHLGWLSSPSRADYMMADEALEQVGLSELRSRPYTEISGGERQLVLIARGLAQRCNILLMDEPTAHLDLSNQQRVLEMINQLSKQGPSFVISSHAPNDALIYADRVMLLKNGAVMAYGTPQETLTETMLSSAYGIRTEVIYDCENGSSRPRAVVAQRPTVLTPDSLEKPGSPLSEVFKESEHTPQLILVTGLSGAGKTTWCSRLVELAQKRGLKVEGVLSPAVFEDGRKTGIDMVNLQNGERRRLAKLREGGPAELATTQWQFDPTVIAWGDHILRDSSGSDLLIIDELGPLEFLRHQGLTEGLRLIDEQRYKVACVVVRSSLLPNALQRWPQALVISGNCKHRPSESAPALSDQ